MPGFTNADLFNCCAHGCSEPDWSEFVSLELEGCCSEIYDNGEEWTISGVTREQAEFFTIYGLRHNGEADR
uniref:Uncharacterized protein n=1 Tax=Ochrobactrum sp. LM19 TaxID=1449781 RepID=A0A0D5A140_9HYPH|nr:hypothetical protein pLM19O2_p85 [Ochrobactrum sp. LM19]